MHEGQGMKNQKPQQAGQRRQRLVMLKGDRCPDITRRMSPNSGALSQRGIAMSNATGNNEATKCRVPYCGEWLGKGCQRGCNNGRRADSSANSVPDSRHPSQLTCHSEPMRMLDWPVGNRNPSVWMYTSKSPLGTLTRESEVITLM